MSTCILYTDFTEKKYLLIKDKDLANVAWLEGGNKGRRVKFEQIAREVQFPLWVGRRWEIDITSRPYTTGHINKYHSVYTVAAIEKVNLTGAVHKAFRIHRQDTMMGESRFSGNAEFW
jgi:hypothetical protein